MLAPEDEDERVRVQWAGKGETKKASNSNVQKATYSSQIDDDEDSERDFTPSEGRTTRDSFWGSLKGSVSPHRGAGRRSTSRRRERGSSNSLNSPLNESISSGSQSVARSEHSSLEREDGLSEPRNISGYEPSSLASRTQSSERSASNDASERDNSNDSTHGYSSSVLKRSTSVSGARAIAPWLTSASTMSGPLKKLSSKGWWQKRYVEVRGPFVCYWRSERASRPDSASVEGSGVGGGGVGFGDAGLDVSMPDAAIDLRTVCGVTVDGFDLVLELIPQDETRRGRRSQVHFRCEAATAHLWQASFKQAIVRYASGGSGLSGGSSGDDSDPPQSPSSEAPPTAARAQTQPRAKSTITAADSLEEEFGTFQSQRTESALLAQMEEMKAWHAEEMQACQAESSHARLSLKALLEAQHEDDLSRVRTTAAAAVAQARATAEAARAAAKLAKESASRHQEEATEGQRKELDQQQHVIEASSRMVARLREQLSSAEATVAEQAQCEAQIRSERDNAFAKVAKLEDEHAASSTAAVAARNEAAALRREVGELRARHLSLGAAVQKRQTEARREVVNLKQERDDVVAKCQGLAAQLESASRRDQERRREVARAQTFAQEQEAAMTARAQEAATAASARIAELSALASAATAAQHQAERIADEATNRTKILDGTASAAVAAARASEVAVERAKEQAQSAAKAKQDEISKRLFAEKRATQAEEKRNLLSTEVKALTAQLSATQSSRDQAQQHVNQLQHSARRDAKARAELQAQVSSLQADLRAAAAATAKAEHTHLEVLKDATASAESRIAALTEKHAQAMAAAHQERGALTQEVNALKSTEAAARKDLQSTQAQLAKAQEQHHLTQTAAADQAQAAEAAAAREEDLRQARRVQLEAEKREQIANAQLQELTAALEAARANILGTAQIGGDELTSLDSHATSPQEAAVERLVSDYVRAIEASKKEAAAFASAVESLTLEHNAAMEQLADAHAQMALATGTDALETREQNEGDDSGYRVRVGAGVVVTGEVKAGSEFAAAAKAEHTHVGSLKVATASAESRIAALTEKHAQAMAEAHQEVDALTHEVNALKSTEAAARKDLQSTQAQLAKAQEQHHLTQTAAADQAQAAEAAAAREEELRQARRLQLEAVKREQIANAQLQELTAALEAARANILGTAQIGGDDLTSHGLSATSSQEAAVERLVSDYVRAIEASKKEAAAFAIAVESLTLEHNATMEQLADAHAQMALAAAADALETMEENEGNENGGVRKGADAVVLDEDNAGLARAMVTNDDIAVSAPAMATIEVAAPTITTTDEDNVETAPAMVTEEDEVETASIMVTEEVKEGSAAPTESSPHALHWQELQEVRESNLQLAKELENVRAETITMQAALRENAERAEHDLKKVKDEKKSLRDDLSHARSKEANTAKILVSTREELAAAKDAVKALESAVAAQDDENRAVHSAVDGVLQSELGQIREYSSSNDDWAGRRKRSLTFIETKNTSSTKDSTLSIGNNAFASIAAPNDTASATNTSSNTSHTPVATYSPTNTTSNSSSAVAAPPTRILSRRRSSVSVGRSSVSVGRSSVSACRSSVSVGRPASIDTGADSSIHNSLDIERSRASRAEASAAAADAEKRVALLQAECDERASVISTHIQEMAALQKRHASALESQHVSFQEEKQRVLIETEASAPEAALVQAYEGREDDANGHSAYRSRVVRNLLAAGYRLSSDLRKAQREIEDLKTAANRSRELHSAHMEAAEADASKLRSLLAYAQQIAASSSSSSAALSSFASFSSSLLSAHSQVDSSSSFSEVAEAEAKLDEVAFKHSADSTTLRQEVASLQEQLKQQQQQQPQGILALPSPDLHSENNSTEIESSSTYQGRSSRVQQADIALKQQQLQQRLQELKGLFEQALHSGARVNAMANSSKEVMPGASFPSSDLPSTSLASQSKLLTVPSDGEHNAVWWYQHRASHRANQLFGLYTFLVATCLDAE